MEKFTWTYLSAAGQSVDAPSVPGAATSFPTQADAETWIGETWAELLEAGVESVILMRDAHEVYGPMGLRP